MKGNNIPDTDDSVAMLGSASVFSIMDAAHAADENASAASFSTDSSIAAYRQVVPSNAATPIDKQLDVRRSAAASESRGSTSHRPVEHADRMASMEAIMGDINKMLNRIDSLTSAMQKQQNTPNDKPRVAPHDSSDDAPNSATVIFNADDASTWTFWLRRDRSGALATQLVMQEVLSDFVGSKKSRKKRFGPFRAHIQKICRLMASMKRITQEAVGAANAAVAATREAVKKSSAVTPAAAQPQPPQTKSKMMSAAAAAAASSPEKPTMKKKKKNRSRCLICLKRGHTLRDCEVRQVLVALAESYMTDSD